jgi:hypothetical protein
MSLIQFNVNPELLKDLIRALTRVADGIDRAYPPKPGVEARKGLKPHGPEDIVEFQPEAEWQREQEEEARQS